MHHPPFSSSAPFTLMFVAILWLAGCADEKEAVEVMEEPPAAPCSPSCGSGEEGHSCCREAYGPRYFCDLSGMCTQAEACTEERCCVPSAGDNGDAYCVELMGLGSICEIQGRGGICSDGACRGCSLDTQGHGCCQEALGASFPDSALVCSLVEVAGDVDEDGALEGAEDLNGNGVLDDGEDKDGDGRLDVLEAEGRCIEIDLCDNETSPTCCVPGPMGDTYCQDPANPFGDSSRCVSASAGMSGTGICAQTSRPTCDGCNADIEGHNCCQGEYGSDFYCGFNGRCEQAPPCRDDILCCVPGEAGNESCVSAVSGASSCEVVPDGGRCTEADGETP